MGIIYDRTRSIHAQQIIAMFGAPTVSSGTIAANDADPFWRKASLN
jgi:hypothetical protein